MTAPCITIKLYRGSLDGPGLFLALSSEDPWAYPVSPLCKQGAHPSRFSQVTSCNTAQLRMKVMDLAPLSCFGRGPVHRPSPASRAQTASEWGGPDGEGVAGPRRNLLTAVSAASAQGVLARRQRAPVWPAVLRLSEQLPRRSSGELEGAPSDRTTPPAIASGDQTHKRADPPRHSCRGSPRDGRQLRSPRASSGSPSHCRR